MGILIVRFPGLGCKFALSASACSTEFWVSLVKKSPPLLQTHNKKKPTVWAKAYAVIYLISYEAEYK
jgi:hypothetical protein